MPATGGLTTAKGSSETLAFDREVKRMVVPAGFEPATSRFGGEHSIQLSYGTIYTEHFGAVSVRYQLLRSNLYLTFQHVATLVIRLRRAALYPAELRVHLGAV
jgi:hypothetical protein